MDFMCIDWAHTVLPLLGFVALFVLVHGVVLARVEPVYGRAFMMSRAVAAVALTGLGIGALVGGMDHWREAFLYRQAKGDWMRLGLLVIQGHFWADFIWMWVGVKWHGIQPRRDLIIHHAMGVLGFGAALVLGVGYAFGLLVMITELLPLSTGIHAWGKRTGRVWLVNAADKGRLYVLAFLRLPLWSALLVLVARVLLGGSAGELTMAFSMAALGLIGLMGLDVYWIGKCRQKVDFY